MSSTTESIPEMPGQLTKSDPKNKVQSYHFSAVRYSGADAGTHVPSQSLRLESPGLSEDDLISKVAENGRAPW